MKIALSTDNAPRWTPSALDRKPWTNLPHIGAWIECACYAFVTVRMTQSDGGVRYRERCPACRTVRGDVPKNFGEAKAVGVYGSWRVENAMDEGEFMGMVPYERVEFARRWIWRARYHEHLASDEWAALRERVIERDGGLCVRCGSAGSHVHHLTYERLGRESIGDLELLCVPCHHAEHGRSF